MKKLLTFCVFFYALTCPAKEPFIQEVRYLYQQAAHDENSCKRLVGLLQADDKLSQPLFLGYQGAATMMMAQYVPNPFTKLSYFKKGKQLLHQAIKEDDLNVELRYLRFATQTKTPVFLAYRDKITKDKTFLLKSLSIMRDQYLKKIIVAFLIQSDFLNDQEKRGISHLIG